MAAGGRGISVDSGMPIRSGYPFAAGCPLPAGSPLPTGRACPSRSVRPAAAAAGSCGSRPNSGSAAKSALRRPALAAARTPRRGRPGSAPRPLPRRTSLPVYGTAPPASQGALPPAGTGPAEPCAACLDSSCPAPACPAAGCPAAGGSRPGTPPPVTGAPLIAPPGPPPGPPGGCRHTTVHGAIHSTVHRVAYGRAGGTGSEAWARSAEFSGADVLVPLTSRLLVRSTAARRPPAARTGPSPEPQPRTRLPRGDHVPYRIRRTPGRPGRAHRGPARPPPRPNPVATPGRPRSRSGIQRVTATTRKPDTAPCRDAPAPHLPARSLPPRLLRPSAAPSRAPPTPARPRELHPKHPARPPRRRSAALAPSTTPDAPRQAVRLARQRREPRACSSAPSTRRPEALSAALAAGSRSTAVMVTTTIAAPVHRGPDHLDPAAADQHASGSGSPSSASGPDRAPPARPRRPSPRSARSARTSPDPAHRNHRRARPARTQIPPTPRPRRPRPTPSCRAAAPAGPAPRLRSLRRERLGTAVAGTRSPAAPRPRAAPDQPPVRHGARGRRPVLVQAQHHVQLLPDVPVRRARPGSATRPTPPARRPLRDRQGALRAGLAVAEQENSQLPGPRRRAAAPATFGVRAAGVATSPRSVETGQPVVSDSGAAAAPLSRPASGPRRPGPTRGHHQRVLPLAAGDFRPKAVATENLTAGWAPRMPLFHAYHWVAKPRVARGDRRTRGPSG